jgi:hypothetical protein
MENCEISKRLVASVYTVEPGLSGPRLSGSLCYPETKSILKIPFYTEEFSSKLRLIRNWPCFVEILRSDKNIRSF